LTVPLRTSFLILLAATFIVSAQDQATTPPSVAVKPMSVDINKGDKPLDPNKSDQAKIAIRYLDKKDGDWHVAETTSFRILHNQDKGMVEKVGKVAEETRLVLQQKWFGNISVDWDGKCAVTLHDDRAKYAKKTGQKHAVGHMRPLVVGDRLFSRSIHLPCKEPGMLEDTLPHEVCHAVMAGRFQGKMPRWADEGMACLAMTKPAVDDLLFKLARYKQRDDLFAVDVLMQTEVEDQFNTMEYYCQSTSLVQYLTQRKGPKTFISFLSTSIRKGYEPALKEHYAISSYGDLEKEWQGFAFKVAKKK
jgi:hypothetical protein